MPIISIEFALFFILFFPLYWAFKKQILVQNMLLLAASLGWLLYLSVQFAATVTLFSLCISLLGQGIMRKPMYKKLFFRMGLLISLGILAFFKYVDFFRPILSDFFGEIGDILMPLGLSYYVFQSIAYLHSCTKQAPEFDSPMRWDEVLLHFSFFPTVTSGPIIRAESFKSIDGEELGIVHQLRAQREVIFPALAITLVLIGLAKKWWLAGVLDNNIVSPVFNNPYQYDGVTILAAIYGYAIQLFFDFSGYSDLVIGMAMLLGFQLPKNFSAPFLSVNIREFWNRWHISLSCWIRDYIYFPLGGSRSGFFRTQLNLLIAMTLSGIWHGYGWNFFIWGLLHGLALSILNIGDRILGGKECVSRANWLFKVLSIALTFTFVCFTFVVFKTREIAEAQQIFSSLLENPFIGEHLAFYPVCFLVLMIIGLFIYRWLITFFRNFVEELSDYSPLLWILPICVALFFIILFAPSGIPGFIYANF